ncbi:efflux RND transporter permease subunit [Candidatus Macondimonas diazotrophica]|jgi:cobalt-zinc-cadmium resistance protein CzcA|nr:efflux RND transporter permease subunit [Candidatus Macondimonas diazotrophica]
MLAALIRFVLAQRLLVFLGILLLTGAGGWVMVNMPIDAYPDVSTTQVKLVVKVAGLTPEEMETRVSAPIEVEMLGIPHQTMLRSTTKYALADITIDFEEGIDIYWARQQVAERLSGVWDRLPANVTGGIAPMTTPLGEMLMFTITGEGVSLAERRSVLDWVIRPALRTVPGVADVNALGGAVRTFEVVPNVERLTAQGISLAQLRETLSANNRNDGAGRLSEGEEAWLVRSEGSVQNLADLAEIVVRSHPTEPVRLSDVATVREGALTRYGGVTANGRGETVEGLVLGLRGANAREVVAGVRAKLDALAPSLPDGVEVQIFYDRGDLVDRAVNTVSRALLEAVVLVLVLLVLFLGDLRAALTVALILPLSAMATFLCMRYFGLTANLMSLGGLAIAIGMLVDAAVVMVENIMTHLSQSRREDPLPRLHLIYRSAREVAAPITSGILIIVIVFLPLLSLQGLEGKLFMPVAATIVFALTSSLLLSLTVIPVLASVLIGQGGHAEPILVRTVHRLYTPALHWALAHGALLLTVALVLLTVAGGLYLRVGKTFMPTLDEGTVIVQLEKLPSITLEASLATDQRVQQALMSLPEVDGVVARTGSDELGLDPMGLNETDSFLQLKPPAQWRMESKAELLEALRGKLDGFVGLNYVFNQPIEMRVSEMLTGVRGDLAVKIFGPDHATLTQLAHRIGAVLRAIPGAEDVYIPASDGALYIRLVPDRLALGRLGLSVDALQDHLRMLVEGWPAGMVYEGDRRTPLMIRGSADLRDSPGDFLAQRVVLDDGRSVPLANLVSVERVEGPVAIKREQGVRNAVAIANVGERDLVGFVNEARRRIAEEVELPEAYYLAWGGEFENQQRAAQRLAIVVPLAIGLVFLLLFSTFGSVRQALLVLTNIPFALIGGIFALWLTGEYLSVPASVGFIALLGIAVLNGVVMVTYFNQLRVAGRSLEAAVIEGAQRRLRPVLMTASIAALGLVPLLFATGPGSEIQRPLAIVVIGGLVSSTLLTLLLLPILYRRFGEASR